MTTTTETTEKVKLHHGEASITLSYDPETWQINVEIESGIIALDLDINHDAALDLARALLRKVKEHQDNEREIDGTENTEVLQEP